MGNNFCLPLIAVSKCMYSWKGCMFRNMRSIFRNLCVKLWCFETCYVCFETYFSILSLTAINGQISISCYKYQVFEDKNKLLQVWTSRTRYNKRAHTRDTHSSTSGDQNVWLSFQRRYTHIFLLCIASVKGEASRNKKSHPSSSPYLEPVQRFVHPPVRYLLLIRL